MTVSEVAALLADKALSVAQLLLPEGKYEDFVWKAKLDSQSYEVHLEGDQKGQWFNNDKSKTGDLVDLWRQIQNMSLLEAVFAAKEWLGIGKFQFVASAFKKTMDLQIPLTERLKKESVFFGLLIDKMQLNENTLRQFQLSEINHRLAIPYFKNNKIQQIKFIDIYDYENDMPHSFELAKQTALFGWQAILDTARTIALTLSEVDSMSLTQYAIPALAIPCFGRRKITIDWLKDEYDQLSIFDKVYFCWQEDSENRQFTETLRERLGRYRCYQVTLPYKTVNLCLQQSVSRETITQCFETACTADPDELKSATDFTDQVIQLAIQDDQQLDAYGLPWQKCQGRIVLRPHELSVWTGINGHGKSQLLGYVMLHCIEQGAKVCIASLELRPERLLMRLTRQLHATGALDTNFIHSAQNWYADRLWLFDLVGSAKIQRLLSVFEYARQRYGIDVFLIDSFMKCGVAEDDLNEQKHFVDQLCDFKNNHPCHIHLIAHPRKSQDENHMPNKMDIKGSGTITDLADNVFAVWRNKDQAAGEPNAVLQCDKQRNGEWEGKISLWFDAQSFQYLDTERSIPQALIS